MPIRAEPLVTGEYYHVYNRGVAKQPIFTKPKHYLHFVTTLKYYLYSKHSLSLSIFLRKNSLIQQDYLKSIRAKQHNQVNLIAYCLMPNHYHLLVKQTIDGGISRFISQLGNSYTRYFNTNIIRIGPAFQGQFKAVRIISNEQLLHTSRYIHLNPYVSGLISLERIDRYQFSSLPAYVSNSPLLEPFIKPEIVLNQFANKEEYLNFCQDHASYAYTLELIKHALIDIEG